MGYSSDSTLPAGVVAEEIVKHDGINLDLSSRKKIVIMPMLNKEATARSKSGAPPKTLILGTSVFSRMKVTKKNQRINADAASNKQHLTRPCVEKVGDMETEDVLSSIEFECDPKAAIPMATSACTKGADAVECEAALQSRKVEINPLPLEQDEPSPYADEYAKCGCRLDETQCPRCRILKLTDM
ncbi:hypothetical protein JR316_0002451 [Psilocybe cubensis]|uniref:Uncharacterized protein n=2 Tax=Psilocybe cubensis TaxID=181762 RepID=A0ACB8HC76_PSICU|nr:hypothetical protein JR316_0002451 [Psilocybe cubensis]KAH9485541.1 hypothetical protein JR316_0002451 [Psilocybe cubensis]